LNPIDTPPDQDPPPAAATTPRRRLGGAAKAIAPIVAAGLVGGGVVYAVDQHSASPASASSAVAQGPQGGPSGFAGGGIAGEQRLQGSVTAKTATTVTVKSSTGTDTYTVDSTTQIERNGQPATLAAIEIGDPVLVHVYPSSSGQMLVERLLAGTSATAGGPSGFGPPGFGAGGTGSPGGTGTIN